MPFDAVALGDSPTNPAFLGLVPIETAPGKKLRNIAPRLRQIAGPISSRPRNIAAGTQLFVIRVADSVEFGAHALLVRPIRWCAVRHEVGRFNHDYLWLGVHRGQIFNHTGLHAGLASRQGFHRLYASCVCRSRWVHGASAAHCRYQKRCNGTRPTALKVGFRRLWHRRNSRLHPVRHPPSNSRSDTFRQLKVWPSAPIHG